MPSSKIESQKNDTELKDDPITGMNIKQEPTTDSDKEMTPKPEPITDLNVEIKIEQEPIACDDMDLIFKGEPVVYREVMSEREVTSTAKDTKLNIRQEPVMDNDTRENSKQEPITDNYTKARSTQEPITNDTKINQPTTNINLVKSISQKPVSFSEDEFESVEDKLSVQKDQSSFSAVDRPAVGSPLKHSKRGYAVTSTEGTAHKLKDAGREKTAENNVQHSLWNRSLPCTCGYEVRSSTPQREQCRQVYPVTSPDSNGGARMTDYAGRCLPSETRVETGTDFDRNTKGVEATDQSHDSRPFVCGQCNSRWRTRARLSKHAATIHTDKAFACAKCDARFKTASHLKGHQGVHLTDHAKIKPYRCTVCGFCFAKKAHLSAHTYNHTGERPFVCEKCPATFNRSSHLKTHLRMHESDHPLACTRCNVSFGTEEARRKHVHSHDGSALLCHVCGAWFECKGNMTQHTRIHTGEKPYSCRTCGLSFPQSGALKGHVRIHTGEKPCRCGECSLSFRQSTSMVSHVTAKHPGCLPWSCVKCTFQFKHKRELNMHEYTAHNADT